MVLAAERILYGRNGSLIISPSGGGDAKERDIGTVANVRNIESRVNIQNTELMLAGQMQNRLRRIGWSGTGTLRIYRVNKMFFQPMLDSINLKAKMPVFTLNMTLENQDPEIDEDVYAETISLEQVKFWSYDWMFDVADFVEQPLEFTFENIKGIDTDIVNAAGATVRKAFDELPYKFTT